MRQNNKYNIEHDNARHIYFVQVHVHNLINVHPEPYIVYIYVPQYIKAVHRYLKRTLSDWWGKCFSFGATLETIEKHLKGI